MPFFFSMPIAIVGQALLGAALLLQAQIAVPPPPRGYSPNAAEVVLDAAGVLRPETIERINRLAFDVKQKSGGEMAVVTLPDLGGRSAEEAALTIGREWKLGGAGDIGDRARNAAVVILVVPKKTSRDGRGYVRIEVARGAEGFINDARAGEIRDEALPALRAADYSAALELMSLRVAERFGAEFGFTLDSAVAAPLVERVSGATGSGRGVSPLFVLVMIVVAMVVLSAIAKRQGGDGAGTPPMYRRRRRGNDWWGGGGGFGGFGGGGGGWGGGGGGGFGGFGGGGGFSGGGAGGSW